MEEALHDMALFRRFAKLDLTRDNMPDESTILRFRRRWKEKINEVLVTLVGKTTLNGNTAG